MGIREERRRKNITQKELADVLGVTSTNVSRYEKGIITPPSDKLKKIADYLGVTVDRLLEKDDINNNASDWTLFVDDSPLMTIEIDKYVPQRNYQVEKRVLECAKGCCELCGQKAPFRTAQGMPYLETHYVRWLSEGGLPTIDNLVALCPNCHRKVHIMPSRADIDTLVEVAAKHRKTCE